MPEAGMLNSLVSDAGARTDARLAGARPTRIITYAWGEKYLELLLSLNLPALLAPGNLPYVAANVPCQVVVLTEERFFSRVASHPAVARAKSMCDVRLVSLDDLIAVPDKYGMALSYVLHRGFADLGEQMTDSWQIFLNADFVLADGSLRALLPHLARGRRIVAARRAIASTKPQWPPSSVSASTRSAWPWRCHRGRWRRWRSDTGTTPFAARPSTSVRSACS